MAVQQTHSQGETQDTQLSATSSWLKELGFIKGLRQQPSRIHTNLCIGSDSNWRVKQSATKGDLTLNPGLAVLHKALARTAHQ